jgi:hypothetical protein
MKTAGCMLLILAADCRIVKEKQPMLIDSVRIVSLCMLILCYDTLGSFFL